MPSLTQYACSPWLTPATSPTATRPGLGALSSLDGNPPRPNGTFPVNRHRQPSGDKHRLFLGSSTLLPRCKLVSSTSALVMRAGKDDDDDDDDGRPAWISSLTSLRLLLPLFYLTYAAILAAYAVWIVYLLDKTENVGVRVLLVWGVVFGMSSTKD